MSAGPCPWIAAAAQAAGYTPVTRSGAKVVHYINRANLEMGRVLDPSAVPVLVYDNTTHGAVLVAAMYLLPRSAGATPPQPGGCLTQWHLHTDLCFGAGSVLGNDRNGPCPAGSIDLASQPMMYVWIAPVPGGPLAPDPSPASEIAAADRLPAPSPPNGTA